MPAMGSKGNKQLRPTRNTGKHIMKRVALMLSILMLACTAAYAQRRAAAQQEETKTFEEAMTRMVEPEVKVYVRPKIADLSINSPERQYYGPYTYKVKNTLTEWEFENLKTRALYQATKEADADVMVATIFDSYTLESDENTLVIEISGFPAKYVNFRNFGESESDFEMAKWVYPAAYSPQAKEQQQNNNTKAVDATR